MRSLTSCLFRASMALTVFAPTFVHTVPSGKVNCPLGVMLMFLLNISPVEFQTEVSGPVMELVGGIVSPVLFQLEPSGAVNRLVALTVLAEMVPVDVSCVPWESCPKFA